MRALSTVSAEDGCVMFLIDTYCVFEQDLVGTIFCVSGTEEAS